jgi:hypothetical protein
LKDVTTPVPHVLLSITFAGPAPSGSADTSRLRQGCSHPPRHHPDQAALNSIHLLRQAEGKGLSPPLEPTAPHGASSSPATNWHLDGAALALLTDAGEGAVADLLRLRLLIRWPWGFALELLPAVEVVFSCSVARGHYPWGAAHCGWTPRAGLRQHRHGGTSPRASPGDHRPGHYVIAAANSGPVDDAPPVDGISASHHGVPLICPLLSRART